MKASLPYRAVLIAFGLCVVLGPWARGQAGFNDDRVMLQGFYWESYRRGHQEKFPQFGSKRWYEIVKENASRIREARFDLDSTGHFVHSCDLIELHVFSLKRR